MNFSKRQADPRRHLVGIAFVIVLHILVIYALMTGLGKKVVQGVRAPIETRIIEQPQPQAAPPARVAPPPPKLEAPPPPFIPPPEVVIQTPLPEPTITAVMPTPPPAPVALAPPAPPVAAPPAAPPAAPAPVSASVVCANYRTVMGDAGFPREALRQGIDKGESLIQFTLSAEGEIKDVKAIHATHPIFARNSIRIVREYKCQGQGHEVVVQVPFGYKLD